MRPGFLRFTERVLNVNGIECENDCGDNAGTKIWLTICKARAGM